MKNTRISKFKYAAAPLALGIALISVPSFAQDKGAEDIVVTGSRIAQPNLTSSSPLSVTTAEQISDTGLTRLEDVLNTLPQRCVIGLWSGRCCRCCQLHHEKGF